MFRLHLLALLSSAFSLAGADMEDRSNIILHHGKVVTVDSRFSIREAVAIRKGRIVATGTDSEILALREPGMELTDLKGRTVLPGLIDSHTHPADACMTEFDHPIPA